MYEGLYENIDEQIEAMAPYLFHYYLLKLGMSEELNFHNNFLDPNTGVITSRMLLYENIVDLLEYYLDSITAIENDKKAGITVKSLSYDDERFSSESEGSAAVRQQVINLVKSGIPVVYTGFPSSGYGHAMVAYDFDDAKDELYFHMGYHPESSFFGQTIANEGMDNFVYTNRLSCVWLEIDETRFEHNCAYNYETTGGTTYCMCNFSMHPEHIHPWVTVEYDNINHTRYCPWCNIELTEVHSFIYLNYSSTQHKKMCSCGYKKYAAHIIRDSTAAVVRCIYCNGIVESGGGAIIGMSVNSIQYITDNGSYVRPDGVIVISDVDYELYLSGELDLDSLAFADSCTQ